MQPYVCNIDYFILNLTNKDENGNLKEIKNESPSAENSSDSSSNSSSSGSTSSENSSVDSSSDSSAGGYMILANGSVVQPESTIKVADLNGAVFVVPGNETVWFAEVVSQGRYRVNEDPEPNWAFYAKYNPGDKISLTSFATYFGNGSPYDYLALEFRGSKDTELGYYITQ